MDIFTNIEKTVRILSLDGGGKGVLSQLIIVDKLMRRIQWKQRLNKVPRPCDYTDIMIGSGIGGAAAILMGRLHLTASETYDDIVQLGRGTFTKLNTTFVKPFFSLDTLKATLSSILERHGYKSDMMMIEDDHSSKKCHVILLASYKASVTGYKSLQTYASPNSVNCTVVDAIAATMAVPDWFNPVAVGNGHERQELIGGSVGYNNPTWEGLLEAKELFGFNAYVSSVISIGSGRSISAVLATNDDPSGGVQQINTDCDQTALRLSGYFRDVPAYSRFSVDNINDLDIYNWSESAITLINTQATSYLDRPEVGNGLDNAVANLLLDVGSITLGKITQAAAVPAGAKSLPRLTSYYVARPEIHETMNQCFNVDDSESQKLLVIQGMAGSGKTQSASFFARTNRRKYRHVFFIDASSAASIKADLQSAIRSLGSAHSQDTSEDALRYLQSTESENWLVIFDNADDPNLALVEFIPPCDHGHVIITTRNPDLALLAPTSHFSMPRMKDGEAVSVLFLSTQLPRPGSETEHQNALEICKLVGSLPLALVQVGCYCYSSEVSFSQYLERYKEHRRKLMDMRPGWQLDQYPHSAYTSISLSYSLLDEKEKYIFHLLSFFHPSSISVDIFRTSAAHQFTVDPEYQLVPRDEQHDQRLQRLRAIFFKNEKWDQYHVDQLLMRLQTLSLVSLGSEDDTSIVQIHPLVQSFAQDIMVPEDFDCFLYMAAITLSSCVRDENIFLFRHLFLHIFEVESQKVPFHPDDTTSFAYVFYAMALFGEARQRWSVLRQRCHEQLGPEHPSTPFAASWGACCLLRLGEYEASANEVNSAILIQERLLGRDHRHTCISYDILALNLDAQGKFREAEVICRESLEISKIKYGNQHEYTHQNASLLCQTLFAQAKYSEAENLLRERTGFMRQVYDEDHTSLLTALTMFSEALMKCDRWEEAEDILRPLVQSYARVFGKESYIATIPLFHLASCLQHKGDLREAEGLQRIVLEVREKQHGPDHSRTVEIRESLEETIRMINQNNSDSDHNVSRNELSRVVDYKSHKVLLTILTVLVVLIATCISISQSSWHRVINI